MWKYKLVAFIFRNMQITDVVPDAQFFFSSSFDFELSGSQVTFIQISLLLRHC